MEIKNAAKTGNKQACTVLAKQLIQIRKQKERTYAANSRVPTNLSVVLFTIPDFFVEIVDYFNKFPNKNDGS